MEPNQIPWLEEGKENNRYKTCLNPEFDLLPPEQIYTEYEMEVPEEVLEFCRVIEKIGGRVLLVGGCVRDAILSVEKGRGKIKPKDIDMEVYGIYPEDLLNEVDKHFGLEKSGTYGKQFEIIKVFGRGRTYDLDISIPRADNKTGSGSRGFEATSRPDFKIDEAARRRDLTCNSVSYDPLRKVVFDPFNGVKDIKENVIRVTDPEKFKEDPVRILRIMQFVARFEAEIDPETVELCRQMMDKKLARKERNNKIIIEGNLEETELALGLMTKSVVELDDESNNRIYDEFVKLLVKGKKPSLGLEFARKVGLIDRYFPWLAELTVTEQEESWHPEGNAWKHTLQVVDAAAEIARREGLDPEQTLTLVMAALCHDLGKPTKTEKKMRNGVVAITSDGHDSEGGWIADEFINAFAPKSEGNFAEGLRRSVKMLTEEHMRPRFCFDEFKRGQNPRKMLGRLARRLESGGTNIYTLSLLAEADQRGRNGKSSVPLERTEVNGLDEWQSWINETAIEFKLFEKVPEKILTGATVIKELEIKPGPLVGVLVEWVFDDQMNGVINDLDEAKLKAKEYLALIPIIQELAKKNNLFEQKGKSKNPNDEIYIWLKGEGVKEKIMMAIEMGNIEVTIRENTERVAALGEWPEYIKRETLIERVPRMEGEKAAGFDAGVACALDLIPRDKQELAAKLHANYSLKSVEQVRNELEENDPDSPTTWWLAACAICKEGEIGTEEFLQQVADFKELVMNPEKRLAVAKVELEKMKKSFEVVNGVPFGTEDGCIQAAYIAGYPVAVMYAKQYDLYFVGTYLPSLEIPDDFEWSEESGPVHGSKQFVKCKNLEEVERALSVAKSYGKA